MTCLDEGRTKSEQQGGHKRSCRLSSVRVGRGRRGGRGRRRPRGGRSYNQLEWIYLRSQKVSWNLLELTRLLDEVLEPLDEESVLEVVAEALLVVLEAVVDDTVELLLVLEAVLLTELLLLAEPPAMSNCLL